MASDPTVCAIMLTKDRPELAARAVRCFRAQAYQGKRLLVFDTSERIDLHLDSCDDEDSEFGVVYCHAGSRNATIGALRNASISHPCARFDAIIHWDDDDYSHPNRIAEQVAFLQSSGAAVVGYNQMLFWDTSLRVKSHGFDVGPPDESWLYTGPSHQPLGTSLCYWRSTWESHRFDDRKHAGEDSDFLARVGHRRVKSVSSLHECALEDGPCRHQPRMIATVHGANTQQKTYDGFFKGGTVEMRRVAEWDERVRQVLEGA